MKTVAQLKDVYVQTLAINGGLPKLDEWLTFTRPIFSSSKPPFYLLCRPQKRRVYV